MDTNTRKHELLEKCFELREKASGARKIAERYGIEQDEAERELMQIMETEGASAVMGESGTLTLSMTAKARLNDWPTLKSYIEAKPSERLDLLERRLSRAGCKERWQAGEAVPGVEQLQEPTLSYRATKRETV